MEVGQRTLEPVAFAELGAHEKVGKDLYPPRGWSSGTVLEVFPG